MPEDDWAPAIDLVRPKPRPCHFCECLVHAPACPVGAAVDEYRNRILKVAKSLEESASRIETQANVRPEETSWRLSRARAFRDAAGTVRLFLDVANP
jgi:hypothetical protein